MIFFSWGILPEDEGCEHMAEDFQIGVKTSLVKVVVSRKDVNSYCNVIGETNTLYTDSESAKAAGYRDALLPSTYPTIFWNLFEIPWINEESYMIQREQYFHYEKPLQANITYHCQLVLDDVRKRGNKLFVKQRLLIYEGEVLAATCGTTLMLVGEK